MNLLVMSISSKVPLLKAIKVAAKTYSETIKVFGSDNNERCIGQYFVDYFWHCPMLKDLPIDVLIDYCLTQHITMIIPTRDGELVYFAQHKAFLMKKGIQVMVSHEDTVRLCLDKFLFSHQLIDMGYPAVPSYSSQLRSIERYVVKERYGSGSLSVGINLSTNEAIAHASKLIEPIFQPYIRGSEYSVDVYVSHHKAKGIIVRKREVIVGGESQVTTTIRMPIIEDLIKEIVEKIDFSGHVMFQLLLDDYDQPHIIECNCRIGGASTLSFLMGLNSIYWFIAESHGDSINEIEFARSLEEKTLIRHAEDLIT